MTFAILLAGGSGTRIHGYSLPKQFITIKQKTLLEWVVNTFVMHPQIDNIVVVAPEDYVSLTEQTLSSIIDKRPSIISGGFSRQASVYQALKSLINIAKDDDTIIIHDVARVLVTPDIISRGLTVFEGNIGLTAAIPSSDTLMYVTTNQTITHALNRSQIALIQTPQIFRYRTLMNAHQKASSQMATDDISLVLGIVPVKYFLGSSRNFKVTTNDDIFMLKNILEQENAP